MMLTARKSKNGLEHVVHLGWKPSLLNQIPLDIVIAFVAQVLQDGLDDPPRLPDGRRPMTEEELTLGVLKVLGGRGKLRNVGEAARIEFEDLWPRPAQKRTNLSPDLITDRHPIRQPRGGGQVGQPKRYPFGYREWDKIGVNLEAEPKPALVVAKGIE